jgi:pimeloyl-ACP methyl ester carboxylesterase
VRQASAPRGFTEKDLDGSSVSIHYAEGPANGLPLMLLHGMARDWRSFSTVLPDLASRFHIFALDLRGHGGSGRALRGYSISQFADDVDEFLRVRLPGGAAVFGHSIGAMVAMSAAARLDSKISALIVGDSMISPDNLASSWYGPLFRQLHELMLRRYSSEELARGIGKIQLMFPEFDQPLRLEELAGNSEAALLEWARTVERTDPEALDMTLDCSAFADWDPERILPRIACPVLLLQANPELDGLLSDSDVKLAMRLLPRVRHVRFPLLGHALFMQQANPVLRAVHEFLAGNADAAKGR